MHCTKYIIFLDRFQVNPYSHPTRLPTPQTSELYHSLTMSLAQEITLEASRAGALYPPVNICMYVYISLLLPTQTAVSSPHHHPQPAIGLHLLHTVCHVRTYVRMRMLTNSFIWYICIRVQDLRVSSALCTDGVSVSAMRTSTLAFSMMNVVMPKARAVMSVLAYTRRTSASGPLVIQNLLPFNT